MTIDGEPWFVAADVCGTLAISNPSQTVSYLDEDEKVQVSSTLISNDGGGTPWVIFTTTRGCPRRWTP
ncbi:Bro-N domain-containing protein [Streptomyces sp. NPDC058459]|uniref:BRO-N domain-containing protein n=1 Tax=Streptomyces sp. NPDC058459 TaxID=3346508 RepID=UPI00365729F3